MQNHGLFPLRKQLAAGGTAMAGQAGAANGCSRKTKNETIIDQLTANFRVLVQSIRRA